MNNRYGQAIYSERVSHLFPDWFPAFIDPGGRSAACASRPVTRPPGIAFPTVTASTLPAVLVVGSTLRVKSASFIRER
jgi:hypothetical protein